MSVTLTTIILSLISALVGTGGGIAAWVKLRELKDRRDESEIGRLRDDVRQAVKGHDACQAKVAELTARLAILENRQESHLARWIKDHKKRVIFANGRAMVSIFGPLGTSRAELYGKTFDELGLDATALREINRMDQQALRQPGKVISSMIQLHPSLPTMHVIKVADEGSDGELVFDGYAYLPNDPLTEAGAGAERQLGQIEQSAARVIPGESD